MQAGACNASYHHGHGYRPLHTVFVAVSDVKCGAKVVEREESYGRTVTA